MVYIIRFIDIWYKVGKVNPYLAHSYRKLVKEGLGPGNDQGLHG